MTWGDAQNKEKDRSAWRDLVSILCSPRSEEDRLYVRNNIGSGPLAPILDYTTRYPLHDAARSGNVDLLRTLIQEGCSVNHSDPDLVKPLHEACFHGNLQCVHVLISSGAEVNARNIDGATPLCDAASSGHVDCVKMLIENGANVNPVLLLSSPLHEASLRDQWQCISVLADAGANLNTSDCHFGTPLHITANQGYLKSGEVLLQAGANVNAVKTHSTPLHEAALKHDTEFIALLLEFGADPHARNNQGLRPIDLILSSTNPARDPLLFWMYTVPTLMHLTRMTIRKWLGPSGLRNVGSLLLPKPLEQFINYYR